MLEIDQPSKADIAPANTGFISNQKEQATPTQNPVHIVQLINLFKKLDLLDINSLIGSSKELKTTITVIPVQPNVKIKNSTKLIITPTILYIL